MRAAAVILLLVFALPCYSQWVERESLVDSLFLEKKVKKTRFKQSSRSKKHGKKYSSKGKRYFDRHGRITREVLHTTDYYRARLLKKSKIKKKQVTIFEYAGNKLVKAEAVTTARDSSPPWNEVTSIYYDDAGHKDSSVYRSGASGMRLAQFRTTYYDHDTAGRIVFTSEVDSARIRTAHYSYDDKGRIVSYADTLKDKSNDSLVVLWSETGGYHYMNDTVRLDLIYAWNEQDARRSTELAIKYKGAIIKVKRFDDDENLVDQTTYRYNRKGLLSRRITRTGNFVIRKLKVSYRYY